MVSGSAAIAIADELGNYLERHGLDHLLAIHLEEQFESANDKEKPAIATRLAALYTTLLQQTEDPAERLNLITRSRELLAEVPDESVDELRLSLLSGTYSAAEKIAEDHRLRLSDEASVERAVGMLDEAIPEFASLENSLNERIEVLDRRLSRVRSRQGVQLRQEAQQLKQFLVRTRFLSGWANYYRAWLAPDDARIRVRTAIESFERVIDADLRRVSPADVSQDLLETESMARTVLGMALAQSVFEDQVETPLQWLALLDGPNVFDTVSDQVPAWRMSILLDHGEFRRVRGELRRAKEDMRSQDTTIPIIWIRLAAAHALEHASINTDAQELAQIAIAELAARGELQQVLDLADRYGIDAIGNEGFAVLYVKAAQSYQAARKQHQSENPTADAGIAKLYQSAVENFERALTQSDVEEFAEAAAVAQSLIGWCYYFQGKLLSASDAFRKAAQVLSQDEAAEAWWMAIVSLDQFQRSSPSDERTTELALLIDDFLEAYPASEYVPQLILRQSESQPSLERVEQLLVISPESDAFEAAQRSAAQMLFQLFKAEEDETSRQAVGQRYLNLALPMWLNTVDAVLKDDATVRERFVMRGRRLLDIALARGIERTGSAEEVFDRLNVLAANDVIDLSGVEDELDYRRFQKAIYEDDWDLADSIADRLSERNDASKWAQTAARISFAHAASRLDSVEGTDREVPLLERIVTFGGRVMRQFDSSARPVPETQRIATFATVAKAARQLFELTGNPTQGERALFLYQQQLLAKHPDNIDFLKAVGKLGSEFGQPEASIEAWRKIATGSAAGTDNWYEARLNLILLQATINPDRAREMMAQFKALYPDFGGEPWASEFREVEQQLGATDDSTTENDDNAEDDSVEDDA